MKKSLTWSAIAAALAAVLWAAAQIVPAHTDLAALFPDNALLYLEAKDFRTLLKDWNTSAEKRVWLQGANYQGFSRSRLFQRLSQAQDEFSAAASIRPDNNLLSSVAGSQSALALYDIGNIEFVYLTRMDQAQVEATPLWQVRDKFEQRTEGSAQFYVHQDQQSNRTAAFAASNGWLVLSTRADLIAAVLDRLQGAHPRSLPDEPWYADALKQAIGPADDLRMVLNLEKLVPSPYFRSYWVQRNITEMKQYRAALCDLHRTPQSYREDRVLLRKPGATATASGNVQPLLVLAPDSAVFTSAQASPDPERVLAELRENLLDLKPEQMRVAWSAPSGVAQENAGSASMLEERIDVAPVIVAQSDPYKPLRTLIAAAQPAALLKVYTTRSPQDEMFVSIDRGIVVPAASPWNQDAIQNAIANALRPGLTASQLGVVWVQHFGTSGNYSALDGQVPLYLAVRENQLFVATSESLLNALLSHRNPSAQSKPDGLTYAAVFRHTPREQQTFHKLVSSLDTANRSNNSAPTPDDDAQDGNGQTPPFFSGNIASLGRMFVHVERESMQEKDEGTQVRQTVVYQWQHP